VSKRDRLKLTPDLITKWVTGNDNFVYSSTWDFKSYFTWDLLSLLSIREEGVLRIFIALKNASP
jgi:hypothetical protein